jgi:hypothetical protein
MCHDELAAECVCGQWLDVERSFGLRREQRENRSMLEAMLIAGHRGSVGLK